MPTATLTFQLPEEADEFRMAASAGQYALLVDEWSNKLRAAEKYGSPAPTREDWLELLAEFRIETY